MSNDALENLVGQRLQARRACGHDRRLRLGVPFWGRRFVEPRLFGLGILHGTGAAQQEWQLVVLEKKRRCPLSAEFTIAMLTLPREAHSLSAGFTVVMLTLLLIGCTGTAANSANAEVHVSIQTGPKAPTHPISELFMGYARRAPNCEWDIHACACAYNLGACPVDWAYLSSVND